MTGAILIREYDNGKQTIGKIFFGKGNFLHTLELPWKENQRGISCIPKGTYKVIPHRSPKFGQCFWVQDVQGRSEILIHQGNYNSQIRGCILVGTGSWDINSDGLPDVVNSKVAMQRLIKQLPQPFTLEIR